MGGKDREGKEKGEKGKKLEGRERSVSSSCITVDRVSLFSPRQKKSGKGIK